MSYSPNREFQLTPFLTNLSFFNMLFSDAKSLPWRYRCYMHFPGVWVGLPISRSGKNSSIGQFFEILFPTI
jgi:hypothetical protein